jgi:hypothetical protein
MSDKREQEPPRQTYGLLSGNFVAPFELDYETELEHLLIGEGVETVLTGTQLTKHPGIASSGWWNMVNPPPAKNYTILADNGRAGQDGAQKLAAHLKELFHNATVRIATPIKPEGGKNGYDWNDALQDAIRNRLISPVREAIRNAPEFTEQDA